MTSLGRVGRILAGNIDPSAISIGRDSSSHFISKSNSSQHVQSLSLPVAEPPDPEKVSNRMETVSIKTNESIESTASSQRNTRGDTPSKITLQGNVYFSIYNYR